MDPELNILFSAYVHLPSDRTHAHDVVETEHVRIDLDIAAGHSCENEKGCKEKSFSFHKQKYLKANMYIHLVLWNRICYQPEMPIIGFPQRIEAIR